MVHRAPSVPIALLFALLLLGAACSSATDEPAATDSTVAVPPDLIGTAPPVTEPAIPEWTGDVVNALDVHLGECINKYSWIENDRRVQLTTQVPCDGPHDREVYFETNFPAEFGAPYPGADFLSEYAQTVCYREFETFVGAAYEVSELELDFTIPPEDAFMDRAARYRGIVCYLLRGDKQPLLGTARNLGR